MSAPSLEVKVFSTGRAPRWSGDRRIACSVLALVTAATLVQPAWRRLDPRIAVTELIDAQTQDVGWRSTGSPTYHRDGTASGGWHELRSLARPVDLLDARDPWDRRWALLPRDAFLQPVVPEDRFPFDGGLFLVAPRVLSPLIAPSADVAHQAEPVRWLVYSRGPDGEARGGLGDDVRPLVTEGGRYLAFRFAPPGLGILALAVACAWVVVRNVRAPRTTSSRELLRCAVTLACLSPWVGLLGWVVGSILQNRLGVRSQQLSPALTLSLPTVVPLSALALTAMVVVGLRARRARAPGT